MPNTGGLEWEPIPENERRGKKWKYRVVAPYHYRWNNHPILDGNWRGSSRLIAATQDGHVVAGLTSTLDDAHSVTLRRDYAWDGSSGPFVGDTPECMRASALHDVWCQAMRQDGMYEDGFRNWRRGAKEYRMVCTRDGMAPSRARLRYVGLMAKGSAEAGLKGATAVGKGVVKGGKATGQAVVKGVKAVGRFFGELFGG